MESGCRSVKELKFIGKIGCEGYLRHFFLNYPFRNETVQNGGKMWDGEKYYKCVPEFFPLTWFSHLHLDEMHMI